MILKGSQRAGAKQLSVHLLNDRDNDHVTVLEVRGFVSDDLHGALAEAHAISKATKCKQFMFSLSLNPPKGVVAGEDEFRKAVDQAEKALGLDDQPRAIVIHEKEGRRHAHVVWSRIDAESMTAINLPFFKHRLTALSKELYLEHGWRLPDGLKENGGKSPLNFTLSEWRQAKRLQLDPREIKSVFQEAWQQSDSLKAMGNALAERGFFIAKGDRRGFVALDVQGEVYALSRWIGTKTRDVEEKLGSADGLPSVDEVKKGIRVRLTEKLKSFIHEVKSKHTQASEVLIEDKANLVKQQRQERQRLEEKQDERWKAESEVRGDRLRKGFMGLVDKVTGRAKAIRDANELDAYRCAVRDRKQRDAIVVAHMEERQELQKRFDKQRARQVKDRKQLARDVVKFMRMSEQRSEADRANGQSARNGRRSHSRNKGRDHALER